MKKSNKKTFTLMELLAVIAIVSVLFTVMLPGFKKMVKGNAVDQQASQIKLMLEQAQSEAISLRKPVAVIIPNGTSGDWPNFSHRLGGMRLAVVEKDKDDNWQFVRWLPDRDWRPRISGAVLAKVLKKGDSAYDMDASWYNTGVPGVVSTPQATYANNTLFDLKKANASDFPYDDTTGNRSNCAIVFSPYGGMYNESLRLVIAEAELDETLLVYPTRANGTDPDKAPVNFVILNVNQFSGKVEYYSL